MDLDDVGAFDFAQVGAAAALINAQERFEVVQGTAVDVQVVGAQLADGGAFARLVDGGGIPGAEEQFIRLTCTPWRTYRKTLAEFSRLPTRAWAPLAVLRS